MSKYEAQVKERVFIGAVYVSIHWSLSGAALNMSIWNKMNDTIANMTLMNSSTLNRTLIDSWNWTYINATVLSDLDTTEYYWFNDDTSQKSAGEFIHQNVLPVVCCFGIVGILLTIIVLSQKSMYTSTNTYLIALASADFCYLILIATSLAVHHFDIESQAYRDYVIYVTYAAILVHVFLLTSIWITVMLAVERYVAICMPFYASKYCSIRNARITIVVIFVLSLVSRLPNFLEYEVVSLTLNVSQSHTVRFMQMTEFAGRTSYVTVYPWIVDVIITTVVPFVLLLILNVLLIVTVRRSTRYITQNSMLTSSSGGGGGMSNVAAREELQITCMLISIIVVFFVCQMPFAGCASIQGVRPDLATHGLILFRYVAMFMLTLKPVFNFILYCWFSEKFLIALKRLFLVRYCSKIPGDVSVTMQSRLESCRRRSGSFRVVNGATQL